MILIIVFLCGAMVMSFEILGSRVLAPNFGNSIFVWGSLISIFLAGLSAGYYWGGKIADIHPSTKKLAFIIFVPGVLFITFPLYSTVLSDWVFMQDMGIRLSPLVASLFLFFIPSVFLGAVSPYTAKLMISSLHTSGATIGTLYALSTLGSIVGTLLTSFYLITVAGVKILIMAEGIILIVIAIPLLFMHWEHPVVHTG
jgi:hypothetical protein